jgi:hypothetical protein
VQGTGGANINLVGCTVVGIFKESGLLAIDEGTRVKQEGSIFQWNGGFGVLAPAKASVWLANCTVAHNNESIVGSSGSAAVNLVSCRVTDSLEAIGVVADCAGTRIKEQDTIVQGNCVFGVIVGCEASIQIHQRTMEENRCVNVQARDDADVSVVGCLVDHSLEGSGLSLGGEVTRAEAKGSKFIGIVGMVCM